MTSFAFKGEVGKAVGNKANIAYRYPQTISADWNTVFSCSRKENAGKILHRFPFFLFIFF